VISPVVLTESVLIIPVHDQVFSTKALCDFLLVLRKRLAPVVVDLGPAVGSNVSFLGEQLGCKLFVVDLLSELDLVKSSDDRESILRLDNADMSVDGIFCWDVLDYLDQETGRMVAEEVKRVLRPGGVVMLCYGMEPSFETEQSRYEIIDDSSLLYRLDNSTRQKKRVLQTREMSRLFEPLTIENSFLLSNQMREMLFRKPISTATGY